jgi:hypothetical protein
MAARSTAAASANWHALSSTDRSLTSGSALARALPTFPPDFFRRLVAERLDITLDEIVAGHCVALSRPRELADMLASYAAGPLRPTP